MKVCYFTRRYSILQYVKIFIATTCFFIFLFITGSVLMTTPTQIIPTNITTPHCVTINTEKVTAKRTQEKEVFQPKERKIIVASYMRSGSSVTGKILERDKDTFYVFEPLNSVEIMRKYFLPAVYLNRPISLLRKDDNSMEKTIEQYLNCDLTEINLGSLNQYHMDKSESTKEFYYCSQNTPPDLWEKNCFQPFRNLCLSRKNTLIKTIRMRIASLEPLLNKYPELKVIHLIRDPRAITLSKANLSPSSINSTIDQHIKNSRSLCKNMLSDLKDSERLVRKYPHQLKVLVYEHLASAPEEVARKLYEFLNMPFTREIEQFVYNSTKAGIEQKCQLCTTKADSFQTAMRWRRVLSIEKVRLFDQYCAPLFRKAGFRSFLDRHNLWNLIVPSWRYQNQPGYLI